MLKEKKSDSYKNIFKSTFLFGFVQIFNILTKVLLNKAAAVFLGTEGVGLIAVFQSMLQVIQTFFGLGISQSAVRDISKASNEGDKKKFSEIITVTNKIIWLTALIGAFVTMTFSSNLSVLSFGNDSYRLAFVILAFTVLFVILAEGQLAILKGMRQLKSLAKATIFGSVVGVLFGVPFYYLLGQDGVVPTLLVVAISSVIFSTFYVKKIKFDRIRMPIKEVFDKSSNMIKMGVALMSVTFMGMINEYIIKIYIVNTSGVNLVGIYQAGLTIVSGYFSIIIVAMMTDYYPRISGVYDNNKKLTEELNKQAKVGLILISPLIVVFMFIMSFFVEFLYSKAFLLSVDYMRYAIFWTLLIIVSNPIDMILIAKQNTKVFLSATIFYRTLGTALSLYAFESYRLEGLGVAMLIMGIIHIVLMQAIMYKLYKIKLETETIKMLLVSVLLTCVAFYLSSLGDLYVKYIFGLILIIITLVYSIDNFKKVTDINLVSFLKKLSRK